LLNKDFVSSWTLVLDLKDLAANSTDLEIRRKAELSLKSYKFPVQCMVLHANGTVIEGLNANELLDSGDGRSVLNVFEDPLSGVYLDFLKRGLAKGKPDL